MKRKRRKEKKREEKKEIVCQNQNRYKIVRGSKDIEVKMCSNPVI